MDGFLEIESCVVFVSPIDLSNVMAEKLMTKLPVQVFAYQMPLTA